MDLKFRGINVAPTCLYRQRFYNQERDILFSLIRLTDNFQTRVHTCSYPCHNYIDIFNHSKIKEKDKTEREK